MVFDTSEKLIKLSFVVLIVVTSIFTIGGIYLYFLLNIIVSVATFIAIAAFYYEIKQNDVDDQHLVTENEKWNRVGQILLYANLAILLTGVVTDIARAITVIASFLMIIYLFIFDLDPNNLFEEKMKVTVIVLLVATLLREFLLLPFLVFPRLFEFMTGTDFGDLLTIFIQATILPVAYLVGIKYLQNIEKIHHS